MSFQSVLQGFARRSFPPSAAEREVAGIALAQLDTEGVRFLVAYNGSGAADFDAWRAADPEGAAAFATCLRAVDRVLDELEDEERDYFLHLHALFFGALHDLDPALSSPELWQRGLELVEAGEHERALAVADRLQHVRFSGAFEVGALALAALGRTDDAISVLELGVRKAPTVWTLYRQLGDLRAERGRPEDVDGAREAYVFALTCPGVDTVELEARLEALDRA